MPTGSFVRSSTRAANSGKSPRVPGFKSAMPAFGDGLNHQEVIAVLTFVKTLRGDKTRGGFSILKPQAIISQKDPFPAG